MLAFRRVVMRSKFIETCPLILGWAFAVVLPPVHIAVLYRFWRKFSRRVDRRYCSCSCWDTVFKGTYETGIASYKHIYFNASKNTFKIWVLTVTCLILLYETIRHLFKLALRNRLRLSMFTLFVSSIFSHYYSWWSYINYWNDEYYSQWNHQLFFTSTELLSSYLVLSTCDSKSNYSLHKGLGICVIALVHIIASGYDQFVENVLQGQGDSHQVLRDLGLMIPDILHCVVPLIEIQRHDTKCRRLFKSRSNIRFIMVTSIVLVICTVMVFIYRL